MEFYLKTFVLDAITPLRFIGEICMSIFTRMRLFQKAATAILAFFMGMMVLVTIVAHTRRSGSTGMDMMKIQQMQLEDKQKKDQQ